MVTAIGFCYERIKDLLPVTPNHVRKYEQRYQENR